MMPGVMQSERPKQAKLGLIIPCYNEEAVLPKLLAGLEKMQESSDLRINVLFIDDGSRDRTFELITEAALKNRSIACLRFSRNFGHQIAVAAGLRYVEGDVVGVLDADLQDPPEVMLKMVDKWAEGYDVVYGVRQNRKEGVMLRGAYALFYRLLKRVANVELPLDAGDFCVMDRRVVDCLKRMPEHAPFIRGLRGWAGFKQTGFPYDRAARAGGESKYDFSKLLNLAVQGLVSFSSVPLRLATWFGLFASAVGFCLMVWALVSALVLDKVPPGWASLAVMVLFFGGVQLIVMGIIGEYVGRIFDEVKNRPHFIIDSSVGWVVKPEVKL